MNKTFLNAELKAGVIKLEVGNYRPGMYVITITPQKMIQSMKFIKR